MTYVLIVIAYFLRLPGLIDLPSLQLIRSALVLG